jgi:hypothetical protein
VDDADVWWVAASGRQMLATRDVPRLNGFSFAEPQHAWVMHEWLFGAPYAWGLTALGPSFFALVAAGSFALTGALVLAATVGRARHAAVGCVVAFVPLVLFAHPTARPTWVALAFPVAMMLVAFRPTFGRIATCAGVALELIWANAHGSFPLGVALLAVAAWAEPVDRRRRIATTMAAGLVTLLNPYGLRLHALVLDYLFSSPGRGIGDLSPITEYAPLWDGRYFAVNSIAATLALAALVLVAVSTLRHREHRPRGVLVLALVPLAAVHARFAPTLAVVATVALLPALEDAMARTRLAAYTGPPWRPRGAAIAAYAAVAAGVIAAGFATVAARPTDAWIDPALGGGSFLRLAAMLPDGANVVTPFRSAGLVLWLASPRGVRVLYDSRNDPYSPEMRRVGLTLLEQPPRAIVEELDRRGATHALVPSPPAVEPERRRGYDGALASAPAWSVGARDGGWCLYARSIAR